MSDYRAVPRYPEAQQKPLSPRPAFADWLAEGGKGFKGTIQQPTNNLGIAYVKPDEHPEERLFFSYKDWPVTIKLMPLMGRVVYFDVMPQEWDSARTPSASNVRFVPE